jgi:hypothetical protein
MSDFAHQRASPARTSWYRSRTLALTGPIVILAVLLPAPAAADRILAVERDAVAGPGPVESYFAEARTLGLEDLLREPWPAIREKLERRPWQEIEQVLALLTEVVAEAHKMRDLGTKLGAFSPLTEADRTFLLQLFYKYRCPATNTCIYVLSRDPLTLTDYRFLMLKFRQVLKEQQRSAALYARIRTWLAGFVDMGHPFDDEEDLARWRASNARLIDVFNELSDALGRYEQSLGN